MAKIVDLIKRTIKVEIKVGSFRKMLRNSPIVSRTLRYLMKNLNFYKKNLKCRIKSQFLHSLSQVLEKIWSQVRINLIETIHSMLRYRILLHDIWFYFKIISVRESRNRKSTKQLIQSIYKGIREEEISKINLT